MRCHQARPEAPRSHPCLREVRHLQHPRSEQEGAGGSCDDTRVTTRTTPPICNSTRSARRSAGLVTAASGKFSGRSSGRLGACGALQQLGGSVLCTRAVDRSLTLCRRRRVHPAGVPQHRPVREQSGRSRPRAAQVPSRPDGPQTRLQRSRGHATSHVHAEPPARPLRTRDPHSAGTGASLPPLPNSPEPPEPTSTKRRRSDPTQQSSPTGLARGSARRDAGTKLRRISVAESG
jgi:hypothetical protein